MVKNTVLNSTEGKFTCKIHFFWDCTKIISELNKDVWGYYRGERGKSKITHKVVAYLYIGTGPLPVRFRSTFGLFPVHFKVLRIEACPKFKNTRYQILSMNKYKYWKAMSDFIASLPGELIDPPLANQNWDEKISGIVMNAFIAMHSMQCMNE